jgi:CBS domain-containing protein
MFDLDARGISEAEADREARRIGAGSGGFGIGTVALDALVTDVPRGPTLALAPEATVGTALDAMRRRARTAVIVVRQHRPLGVVTTQDIITHADGDDSDRLPLLSVMAPCPVPLRASDTVGGALRRMCALGRWHLPLVCDRGLLLGSLDVTDLVLWLRDRMTLLSVEAL